MAAPAPPRPVDVIDLVSSDDDGASFSIRPVPRSVIQDMDWEADSVTYGTPPLPRANPDTMQQNAHAGPANSNAARGGTIINIDGEEIYIPDDEDEVDPLDDLPHIPGDQLNHDRELALALDNDQRAQVNDQEVTADLCLARVLDIFPDISHEYVYNLFNGFDHEGDYEVLPGAARLDNIIEQLVSSTIYPKQEKGKKRKREASVAEGSSKKWDEPGRVFPYHLKGPVAAMLKSEFPLFPLSYINTTMIRHKNLYLTYIALAKAKDDADAEKRAYGRGRPSASASAITIATNAGSPELAEEMDAARQRVEVIRQERVEAERAKRAEEANLRRAAEAGETAECSACFDDLPMNRQIHCDGPVAHFTCFECAETYIKAEIGDSRCNILCPSGCGVGFAHRQLNLLSNKQILEKLSQLQQEKDIRDAGLDDLEECPFCEYKAILPPIEEDFEFRCANPECEKVSCRRCKAASHVPISCDQHAKDNKLGSRHKVEEAMTAALIRSCNKCKKQFIKDFGCNKMTCPSCSNVQCYVCSETIKTYDHFDQNPHGGRTTGKPKCPLHDNVEERHEREVKAAEAAARAQVVQDNPDVTAEDLEIKVSDAVKKAASDRIRQAGGPAGFLAAAGGHNAYPRNPLPPFAHYPVHFAPPPLLPPGPMLHAADDDYYDAALDFEVRPRVCGPVRGQAEQEARARLNDLRQRRVQAMALAQQNNLLQAQQNHALQAQAAPMGQPFQLQGYIPVLGYPPNPHTQHAPPALPQPPQANAQAPQNFNLRPPMPAQHVYGLDGAADEYANAPRNNRNPQIPFTNANPMMAPNQQPFNGNIREHRQGFQQLEMLRQRHDQRAQESQQRRQEMMRFEENLRQNEQRARGAQLQRELARAAERKRQQEDQRVEELQRHRREQLIEQERLRRNFNEQLEIREQFERFTQQTRDAQRQH